MTYGQLDGLVNKWSLELEDQEKHFLHQATLANAWDYTLMKNGEKITALHGEVEKVKLFQKRLEQELDFILSQQKELKDLLIPLEESLKDHSGSVYPQYIDEHEKTYKLAENVDAQLKQMTARSQGHHWVPEYIWKSCWLYWPDMLQRKVEEVTQILEDRHCKEEECNVKIAFD